MTSLSKLVRNNKAAAGAVVLAPVAVLAYVYRDKLSSFDIVTTVRQAATMPANIRAFLNVVRACEGTSGSDGYKALFGYGVIAGRTFESFADHPRKSFPYGGSTTSAAGAYQILAGTWDTYKKAAGCSDFSPTSQDKFAVYLLSNVREYNGVSAYDHLMAGRLTHALLACAKEWASLPTSTYNQPTKTLDFVVKTFKASGGVITA